MDRLPNELIERIFSYLDEDSLAASERVCVGWSRIVVARVWFPRIRDQVRENDFLEAKLESHGWSASLGSLNYELNHRLFRKLSSKWTNGKCDKEHKTELLPSSSDCVKVKQELQ